MILSGLQVWQQAMDLAEHCYQVTRSFPKDEFYGAVAQIRGAAALVPAKIAGDNGRESRGEYIQFLRIAQGSLKEGETHILLAQRIGLPRENLPHRYLANAKLFEKCSEL